MSSSRLITLLACAALSFSATSDEQPASDHDQVRGMTISCQTWGKEWGTDGFAHELEALSELGVNWIAIHPYASIRGDGSVSQLREELDPQAPPIWLARPRSTTRAKQMAFFVKPHLAYWGSPFRWRGEVAFEDGEDRARFWKQYSDWIVKLASATSAADAFCVGTELDALLADETQWRELIARVREVTRAHLTYAANWDKFEQVPFWDALDAIGVQAYFPLSSEESPSDEDLASGWQRALTPLRELSERMGKPVVFTELGYAESPSAAARPWEDPPRDAEAAPELQLRCLRVGLEVLGQEREWLRGAFLWKWFVGEPHRGDASFYLDQPPLRDAIRAAWTR